MKLFKNVLLVFTLLYFISCASEPKLSPNVGRKIACVERLLDKSVEAIKARDVCKWGFERQ